MSILGIEPTRGISFMCAATERIFPDGIIRSRCAGSYETKHSYPEDHIYPCYRKGLDKLPDPRSPCPNHGRRHGGFDELGKDEVSVSPMYGRRLLVITPALVACYRKFGR